MTDESMESNESMEDKAKRMMEEMKSSNEGKFLASDNKPLDKPDPIKILGSNEPETKAPIDNLIDEARKRNETLGKSIPSSAWNYRVIWGNVWTKVRDILKDGGMDSMSVNKSLARIQEVFDEEVKVQEIQKEIRAGVGEEEIKDKDKEEHN